MLVAKYVVSSAIWFGIGIVLQVHLGVVLLFCNLQDLVTENFIYPLSKEDKKIKIQNSLNIF